MKAHSCPLECLPEDDAYQTFLEDEFAFEIALAAKGQKRLILQEPPIFCREYTWQWTQNGYNWTHYGFDEEYI